MCRREHRLTWAEFQDLTLAQYEALEERRAIEVRHARFNAALCASATYNVAKAPDSPALSPFDFLPGYEKDPAELEREAKRKSVRDAMYKAMNSLPDGTTPEQAAERKATVITGAKAAGIEDAEDLYKEIFPD